MKARRSQKDNSEKSLNQPAGYPFIYLIQGYWSVRCEMEEHKDNGTIDILDIRTSGQYGFGYDDYEFVIVTCTYGLRDFKKIFNGATTIMFLLKDPEYNLRDGYRVPLPTDENQRDIIKYLNKHVLDHEPIGKKRHID